MCMGGGTPDYAKQQREQEAQRQEAIRKGTSAVDDVFSSFNDDYYNTQTQAYKDYYLPEIDRQYKTANDKLVNNLGANLNGSEGAKQIGELLRQYEQAKSQYAQQALDYANGIKTNIASNRSNLITQLEGGGSIDNATSQARTLASAQMRPATFSPLASLFSSATAQAANAAANSNSLGYGTTDNTGLFTPTGSSSSVKTIR